MAYLLPTSVFDNVYRIIAADYVKDTVVNTAIQALVNRTEWLKDRLATEDAKWDLKPKGTCQPFIPEVMGADIATWLAAHPKWAKLNNTLVADIEGRAIAVASATHAAGAQFGSDDAVVVSHSHTVTAHNQNALADSTSGGDIKPAAGDQTLTTSTSGVSGVNKNIQRTQYLNWIVKTS